MKCVRLLSSASLVFLVILALASLGCESGLQSERVDFSADSAEITSPFGPSASNSGAFAGPFTGGVNCLVLCTGKTCGDDGCGGVCGTCDEDSFCADDFVCTALACSPSCTEQECGDDGCGGLCGACELGEECDLTTNLCAPSTSSCAPDCLGKTCGSDGCGGLCGTCPLASLCTPQGTCSATCEPDCNGKSCGDDACGGLCGLCLGEQVCNPQGICSNTEICVPNCDGKSCGIDNCGGVCGTCGPGTSCDGTFQCVKATCTPNCNGKTCGGDGCGGICGSCGAGSVCDGAGVCQIQAPTCSPNCANKQCGSDGCGGICGSCGAGTSCNDAGICASNNDGGGTLSVCSHDGNCTGLDVCCDATNLGLNINLGVCTPFLLCDLLFSDGGGNSDISCSGNCGGQAPSGCYCDNLCVLYGDCCGDACAMCGFCG